MTQSARFRVKNRKIFVQQELTLPIAKKTQQGQKWRTSTRTRRRKSPPNLQSLFASNSTSVISLVLSLIVPTSTLNWGTKSGMESVLDEHSEQAE
jgi:hypothetical protein